MSPKKTMQQSGGDGIEKRKARRRPVLDTFSLFVVVPKKGDHRLPVHDVSDHGIGFDVDTEGEQAGDFPIKAGDPFEMHFYLNQSLFLPLTVQVMRIVEKDGIRRIGAELKQKDSKGYKAFQSFLTMLDSIVDAVRIDPA